MRRTPACFVNEEQHLTKMCNAGVIGPSPPEMLRRWKKSRSSDTAPGDVSLANVSSQARDIIPSTVDSHLHLDRMGEFALKDIVATIKAIEQDVPITIRGGVAVFCDSMTYPGPDFHLPSGRRMAVGIHPKKAAYADAENLLRLRALVGQPKVALGEIT